MGVTQKSRAKGSLSAPACARLNSHLWWAHPAIYTHQAPPIPVSSTPQALRRYTDDATPTLHAPRQRIHAACPGPPQPSLSKQSNRNPEAPLSVTCAQPATCRKLLVAATKVVLVRRQQLVVGDGLPRRVVLVLPRHRVAHVRREEPRVQRSKGAAAATRPPCTCPCPCAPCAPQPRRVPAPRGQAGRLLVAAGLQHVVGEQARVRHRHERQRKGAAAGAAAGPPARHVAQRATGQQRASRQVRSAARHGTAGHSTAHSRCGRMGERVSIGGVDASHKLGGCWRRDCAWRGA